LDAVYVQEARIPDNAEIVIYRFHSVRGSKPMWCNGQGVSITAGLEQTIGLASLRRKRIALVCSDLSQTEHGAELQQLAQQLFSLFLCLDGQHLGTQPLDEAMVEGAQILARREPKRKGVWFCISSLSACVPSLPSLSRPSVRGL
jgi:hypothetical protein